MTLIFVDAAGEQHLARAVAAYVNGLRNNGMRPPAALVQMQAAFGDPNRQRPTERAPAPGPGEPEPSLLLDRDEVADRLRVSLRSVQRLIADGSLPSVRVGRSRRVRVEDLRRYVAELAKP